MTEIDKRKTMENVYCVYFIQYMHRRKGNSCRVLFAIHREKYLLPYGFFSGKNNICIEWYVNPDECQMKQSLGKEWFLGIVHNVLPEIFSNVQYSKNLKRFKIEF